MNATINVADFVTKHGIKLTTTKLPFRPDGDKSKWDRDASHYACELSRPELGADGNRPVFLLARFGDQRTAPGGRYARFPQIGRVIGGRRLRELGGRLRV